MEKVSNSCFLLVQELVSLCYTSYVMLGNNFASACYESGHYFDSLQKIYLQQRWVYTKAKEQSTPGFGDVQIEFRNAFLNLFSLRGTGRQCSLLEFTCGQ